MKKLFLPVIVSFVIMSFTYNSNSINRELGKPWWAIALVDAGGALNGAGAVASACPGCAATPVGQGAIVLGGVITGASASIGYAGMVAPSSNGDGGILPDNPQNNLDDIGNKHNQLVNNFIRDNKEITDANFFSYISKNKGKYGEGKIYLTEDFFSEQLNEINSLNETSDILDYIGGKLPKSINQSKFRTELSKIIDSSSKKEFISKTKNFENQFFEENSFEKGDEIAMKAFFSTLRFSASIW